MPREEKNKTMDSFEIRQLTCPELKEIYRSYMKDDFPLMELRPWFAIERAWEHSRYAAYGYYEGERLLAYAAFYLSDEHPFALLDYYAVLPDLRGSGIGTSFLRELLPAVLDSGGILIEAESADSAKTQEEKIQRQRRINFYLKNGAVMTGVNCQLFGVDYNILSFFSGREGAGEDELFDTVCCLYQEFYRPVYGRLCKPYKNDAEQADART